jgi:hypothetical protein
MMMILLYFAPLFQIHAQSNTIGPILFIACGFPWRSEVESASAPSAPPKFFVSVSCLLQKGKFMHGEATGDDTSGSIGAE